MTEEVAGKMQARSTNYIKSYYPLQRAGLPAAAIIIYVDRPDVIKERHRLRWNDGQDSGNWNCLLK